MSTCALKCNAAEKKISIGSDAQAELEQAQALKSLEIEARKVNGAEKKAAKAEVLKLKNRLSSLKRQCLLGPSASVSTGVNSTNTKRMPAGGRGSTEREHGSCYCESAEDYAAPGRGTQSP